MNTYISWIPNLSGRLSFSAIGNSEHPTRVSRANVLFDGRRYLIAYQKRYLSDTSLPFPSFIARFVDIFFLKKFAKFVFVVIAVAEESRDHAGEEGDSIAGQVLIFPASVWKNYSENTIRESVKELNDLTIDSSFTARPCRDKAELLRSIINRALENSANKSAANIEFSIERSGICRLSLKHDAIVDPVFPSPYEDGDAIRLYVIPQVYFFLRDITHTHQHHSPSSDNLLDVYPEDDSIDWRSQVLYSLFRAIIDFRKRGNLTNYYFSLGMLSYASAFRNTAERQSKSPLPDYNFEELRHSLAASIGSIESVHNEVTTRQAFTGFLGAVAAVTAVVLTAIVSISGLGTAKEHLIGLQVSEVYWVLTQFVAQRPGLTMIFLAFSCYALHKFLVGPANKDIAETSFSRNVVRLAVAFPKSIAVIILSVIGALLWYLGLRMISYSLPGF